MTATARSTGPTRRELLRWELCWTPIEMALAALGLGLGLGFDQWTAASFILFALVPLSFVVRFRHYQNVAERRTPE
ncbi:MAG: hypothetical protein JNL96_10120 [Planctomycetaceae bacterium]|nr:hypothetical protein [Planctomycetaceae bacterium]